MGKVIVKLKLTNYVAVPVDAREAELAPESVGSMPPPEPR